jgi:hypothetical protein
MADPDICFHCKQPFRKKRIDQYYCSKKACQRARKANWQQERLKSDPDYRRDQQQANEDWKLNNPDYWMNYRKNNPKKARRNRILQKVRNRKRYQNKERGEPNQIIISKREEKHSDVIAKMDASKTPLKETLDEFWIIPVIAKMDALKANILIIP